MTSGIEPMRDMLRRLYADVDSPDVTAAELERYFSDDFVDFDRSPMSPGELTDKQAHIAFFEELKRGFSQYRHTINLLEPLPDDKIVVYWTFQGTHSGTFFNVPASQQMARINGIDIYTVDNGLVTEQRHVEDVAGLMQQISG